ncbi:MAG: hypothetical protein FWD65_07965 [Coriobacteriia bacterium]|nr:hypothetical protein [Coriobacteriia bacterium]
MLKPRTLLIVGGALWAIAGINIAIIGLRCSLQLHQWWIYLAAIPVFLVFRYVIFGPVGRKYAKRLTGFTEDRVPVWRVYSLAGYLIMVFMMALGITLRVEHLVPTWSIAFFYLGLGLALLLASWAYFAEYKITK